MIDIIDIILPIISLFIGFILGLISMLFVERIKYEEKPIKIIRVLAIDENVDDSLLKYLEKELAKNKLFKGIKIIMDYPKGPTILDNILDNKAKIFKKMPKRQVEGYNGIDNEVLCLSYEDLCKELNKLNKNVNLAELGITTFPLWDKDTNEAQTSAGIYDFEKKRKNEESDEKWKGLIKTDRFRISIVSYGKQDWPKKKNDILDLVEHQLAHLLGIDSYKFAC